jgi:hypothetical protein
VHMLLPSQLLPALEYDAVRCLMAGTTTVLPVPSCCALRRATVM